MATFLESPRFPDDVAFWAQGGAQFNTVVAGSTSGREKRNSLWQYARGQWRINNVSRTVFAPQQYNIAQIRNFFRAMKGQAYAFRFRDWTDYQDEGHGIIGQLFTNYSDATFVPSGVGNGQPTLQLYKTYSETPFFDYRVVQKPYPTGVLLYRNGILVPQGTPGVGASLDTTTGQVTFVADSTATTSSGVAVTAGNPTTISLASLPSNFVVGAQAYFQITGSGSSTLGDLLNNKVYTITAVNTGGLFPVISINLNTTGVVTNPAGGNVYMFPQQSDVLTWTGMFDTPCRFNGDWFDASFDTGGLVNLNLEVIEVRL